MSKDPTHFKRHRVTRHYVRVVAFAVLGASLGALVALNLLQTTKEVVVHEDFEPKGEVSTSTSPSDSAYTLPKSEPTRLRIPKLDIDVEFEIPLGLNDDRTIEVPKSFKKVGWYKFSPTPGELGPAVVLGHVDSYLGPEVFFYLGQLEPGDTVEIDRADGQTAVFRVTALERYEQSGFPTELVYGDIDHAGLRLITCSGTYDRETLRYTHNLVVFAELVEPESPPDRPVI